MKRLLLALLTLTVQVNAGTYYISFTDGANGNPGTKVSPWKYHPWMNPFSSSYTHSAGDIFVFKGSDTWPNACFTMALQGSGNPGNPDTLTVDKTWYRGAAWSKPQWSAGGVELAGGFDVFVDCSYIANIHDVTIDNIDFTGMYWSGSKAFAWVTYVKIGLATNIKLTNCNFRNWTHGPLSTTPNQLYCVFGSNASPFNQGCEISDCLFDGETAANQVNFSSSGGAVINWGGKFLRNTVRNISDGVLPGPGSPEVAYNNISVLNGYDPGVHSDAIQNNGGSSLLIHDNYFTGSAAVCLFVLNGYNPESDYVYNNVFYGSQSPMIQVNTAAGGGKLYFYGNTVYSPGFSPLRVVYRPSNGNVNTLDIRNNHFITDSALISVDAGSTISTLINNNNVTMSSAQASAAGYVQASLWKPPFSNSATVNTGVDLSSILSGTLAHDILSIARPQGSSWDIGAYEYVSGQIFPGALSWSSSVYNAQSTNASVTLTINRTGGSDGAVGVNWSTAQGSALPGHDYTTSSGTASFIAGSTTPVSVVIPLINSGDTAATNRTFTVTLSSASGGASILAPATATVSISLPTPVVQPLGVAQLVASAYSVAEVGPSVTITAQRANGTNGVLTATYTTANVTAVAGHDYTATSGTLTWASNDASNKIITVPIINSGDTSATDRTFTFTLSGSSLGSPTSATVTIIMNPIVVPPPVPGTIAISSGVYNTASTAGSVSLTIIRAAGSDGAVGVSWATSPGTATAGHDYTTSSGIVSFGAGSTTPVVITVPILNSGDTSATSRTFTVTISTPTGGASIGSPSTATVYISLPTPPIQPLGVAQWLSGSYSVIEAGPSITLTAQRANGTNGILTANYQTIAGSALPGHDYTSSSGTLTWLTSDNGNKTITIPIIDSLETPGTNRIFTVTLTGASLGTPTTASVTIIMRPPITPPPPSTNAGTIQLSAPIYYTSETQGSVTLYAQRLNGTNAAVSIAYATSNGNAVAGTDYVAGSGTLNWSASDNSAKPIALTIINSGTISVLPRVFNLTLSTPTGGATLGAPNTAVISVAMNAALTINATIGRASLGSATIGR